MASQWRFVVEDPTSGIIITHDLPLVGTKVTDALNRPGALTGRLPLDDDHATLEVLLPGARAIYAMRDDVIVWGGPLWEANVPAGDNHVDITCEGWLGYWDHRTIWRTRTYTLAEQFDIFAELVADAQDDTNAAVAGDPGEGQVDLGITVGWDAPSGVLRDRVDQYADHQAKNLGDALRELAGVEDGFDMAMRYTLTGSGIDKEIRLHYPMLGRDLRDDASHRFEFEYDASATSKTNVISRGVGMSADDMAWRVRGWGEGTADTRVRHQHVDATAGLGYLPLDAAPSWSTVSRTDTLGEHTREYGRRYNHPTRIPSITVDSTKDPQWGSYQLGDIVPLDIRDRSPLASYQGPARIIGWAIDPRSDRPTLTLEPG